MIQSNKSKTWEKKAGGEVFQATHEFPRRVWDQSDAGFNRFLHMLTFCCYSWLSHIETLPTDLVIFTEEILNGKLHFLRSFSS